MTDIYLNPSTDDIDIQNGLIRLTSTVAEATRQRLQISLNTYRGEWFLDISIGIPYFQMVLKENGRDFADTIIMQAIREDAGVRSITEFSSRVVGNSYLASFTATTTDDEIITVIDQQLT